MTLTPKARNPRLDFLASTNGADSPAPLSPQETMTGHMSWKSIGKYDPPPSF